MTDREAHMQNLHTSRRSAFLDLRLSLYDATRRAYDESGASPDDVAEKLANVATPEEIEAWLSGPETWTKGEELEIAAQLCASVGCDLSLEPSSPAR